jgi:heat shock protein HtpX
MKRILLFLATNLAVVLTIGAIVKVTGLDRMIYSGSGIRYVPLLIMSSLWGFGGAFISLALSKTMAKVSAGVKVIKNPASETERWLLETVAQQAKEVGLKMPEVGIFDSASPNAFATGARRNAALVAVSSGLLRAMDRDQVKAVLGHEMAHVANGDMITMTLLQGVVNSFVVFFSKIIGFALASRNEDGRRHGGAMSYVGEIIAQVVLTLLGSLICAWFSRQREYRADAGGAKLGGRQAMIDALATLGGRKPTALPSGLKAFGISGGIRSLFSTHPPIEQRIAALQADGRS